MTKEALNPVQGFRQIVLSSRPLSWINTAFPFEAPQSATPANLEVLRAAAPKRTLIEDVGSGWVTCGETC